MFNQHKRILVVVLLILYTIFTYSQSGPGGVGNTTTTVLWLSGDFGTFTDAGVTPASNGQGISQWNDRSGNDRHATQVTPANQPIFSNNAANGYPGLRFTGNLFIDGPALGMAATSSYTYLICFRDSITGLGGTNDGNGHFILDRTSATNNLVSLKPVTPAPGRYFYQKRNNAGGGLGGIASTTAINTNTKIITLRRAYNTNYQLFYNNAQEGGTLAETDGPTTPPPPRIGRHATTVNGGLRGYINEFIIYSFALNTAQRIIVNNYLAAKYGLTLAANDLYTQDNPANGNYDHDVAGIGRIDASNIQNDSQGSGIVRILNPSGLDDDEFLFWGHDNGIQQAVETVDVPLPVQARFERVWRVSEVNTSNGAVNVGALDIRFDLTGLEPVTASDLRLLIDDNNNGVFSDDAPISGAVDLGGGIYEFQNVPGGAGGIRNNRRFTLGTINAVQTPLPITLISFHATKIDNHTIRLDWQTASEINNDYFTVERSKYGQLWEPVATVDGAGDSFTLLKYSAVDEKPYPGLSYYRLKQTDFDGHYSYSTLTSINLLSSESNDVSMYPNPTTNKIVLVGSKIELEQISLINSMGQDVTSEIVIEKQSGTELIIDMSALSSGVYYLKTFSTAKVVYKL